VARLAGLPAEVVARAREILIALEQDELARGGRPSLSGASKPGEQLGLFSAPIVDDELTRRLAGLDVDRLTPIDALTTLAALVRDAKARL
jgi:DNA mismatch repair protein MutS